jgi:carnosine synthase
MFLGTHHSYFRRVQFDMYDEMGLRLVLVDGNAEHPCKNRVWRFVHIATLSDHSKDEENSVLAVEAMKKMEGLEDPTAVIDGVTTIYDPCVVVCARVSRLLGKHCNNPEDHEIAKDKYKLAKMLDDMGTGTGCLTPATLFIAKSAPVHTVEDVEKALVGPNAPLSLPAVLKNTHGMCGIGVKLVRTVDEAKKEFLGMHAALVSEISSDGSGLSFESSMFLMEYLDGTEHDVDIVCFKGELVCAIVTDNGPTRLPYFNESSACMPSQRHKDEVAALVAGAHECCKSAGLHSGVFNVEMKYTSSGEFLLLFFNIFR